jgi:TRAP-type C4-dicarboxylate transport system substrate-binding protein
MAFPLSARTRRPLFVTLALLTALALAPGARALTLKAAHSHGESQRELRNRVMEVLANQLDQRIGGLSVKIYPRETLFKEGELWTGLTSGTLEIAALPLARLRDLDPIFGAPSLPGLAPDEDHAHAFSTSPAMGRVVAALEGRGVRVLAHVWVPGTFVSTGDCLAAPDDFKGERIAAGGRMVGDLAQARGAESLAAAQGNGPHLLDGGQGVSVVAATEMDLTGGGHPEGSVCVTLGNGYFPWFDYEPIVIARSAWNRLTPSQQAALTEAAAFAESYGRKMMGRSLETRLQSAVRGAMTWKPFTKEEYEAWRRLSLPVLASLVDLPLSAIDSRADRIAVANPAPHPTPAVPAQAPASLEEEPASIAAPPAPPVRVVVRRAVEGAPPEGLPADGAARAETQKPVRVEPVAIAEPEVDAPEAPPSSSPSPPPASADPAPIPLGLGP